MEFKKSFGSGDIQFHKVFEVFLFENNFKILEIKVLNPIC